MDEDEQLNLFHPPSIPFDLHASRARRDEGVSEVEDNSEDWTATARARILLVVAPGWEGRAEELRSLLLDTGLPAPHSPNCWGALILWCTKMHILVSTGEHEQMRDPRSHARSTPILRRPPLESQARSMSP